jgi:hypothetical protein
MKKSAFLVFGLIAVLSFSAHANQFAEAHISKKISFPLSSLQKVEQSMQASAARTGDSMKTEVSYAIDTNLTLKCAEESPILLDGHLYGCALQTQVDLGGGATATLQNIVWLSQSSAEVSDILSTTDVNKVDTVALKSPFDGGHGSAYYCNADSSSGVRQWACYINFVD